MVRIFAKQIFQCLAESVDLCLKLPCLLPPEVFLNFYLTSTPRWMHFFTPNSCTFLVCSGNALLSSRKHKTGKKLGKQGEKSFSLPAFQSIAKLLWFMPLLWGMNNSANVRYGAEGMSSPLIKTGLGTNQRQLEDMVRVNSLCYKNEVQHIQNPNIYVSLQCSYNNSLVLDNTKKKH